MKKKRVWLIVLALLVLGGFTGFPGFPAIYSRTTTHCPPDYVEGGSRVTTTICRGIPSIWKSCQVRIRQSSADTEIGLGA